MAEKNATAGPDDRPPAEKKKAGLWQRLFTSWKHDDPESSTGLAEGSGAYTSHTGYARPHLPGLPCDDDGVSSPGYLGDYAPFLHVLPSLRQQCYDTLDFMALDSSIDSAIKMHLSHALSAKTDTGEIVFIESVSDTDDPVVNDLRDTFQRELNENLHKWAYQAALYGVCYVRPYIKEGEGVVKIRHDYYTHPSHVKEFHRAGDLVGFCCEHQRSVEKQGQLRMMEPWKLVPFKIPMQFLNSTTEPVRLSTDIFDIDSDAFEEEAPVETQDYGSSLILRAYGPWLDLHEALLAVNTARRNSAKKDRFVGVNVGKENPSKAAHYFNTIANQFKKSADDSTKRALSKGYVSTVDTKLFPITASGNGRLEIQTEEGQVDIAGIADIDYHTSRFCAALGVDKSLLGYTQDMAGGLGEGGYFRTSVTAAIKANLIRSAVMAGIERLFDIHVAAKHGKVYPENEKPWLIKFNSLNTAIEKEEADARESRVNFALQVAGLMQTLDQELSTVNKPEFFNWVFTDLLHVDEEKFKAMINAKKFVAAEGEGGEPNAAMERAMEDDEPDVMDSATARGQDDLKQIIYGCIAEVFGNE